MKIRMLIVLGLFCISNNLFSMSNNKEKINSCNDSYLAQVTHIPTIRNIIYDYLKQWIEFKDLNQSDLKKRLLFSLNNKYLVVVDNDEIKLWDIPSCDLLFKVKSLSKELGSIAYTHNNKYLAVGCKDGLIRILDAESYKSVIGFYGHNRIVTSLDYCQNGKYLASASYDATIKIWNAENYKLLRSMDQASLVTSLTYSQNGKYLAASCGNNIKIWDANTYNLLYKLDHHNTTVNILKYSACGKHLASGDHYGVIRIWDAEDYKLLHTITEHAGSPITSMTYSIDKKYFASANCQGIMIWDAHTYELLQTLESDNSQVNSLVFVNDSKFLASAYSNGIVKVLHFEAREKLSKQKIDISSKLKDETSKCDICEYEDAKIKCSRCQKMLYCSRACKDTGMHSHLNNCNN